MSIYLQFLRHHSHKRSLTYGEVSLYSRRPVLLVWIQLLCLCWINNSFACLVKSKGGQPHSDTSPYGECYLLPHSAYKTLSLYLNTLSLSFSLFLYLFLSFSISISDSLSLSFTLSLSFSLYLYLWLFFFLSLSLSLYLTLSFSFPVCVSIFPIQLLYYFIVCIRDLIL